MERLSRAAEDNGASVFGFACSKVHCGFALTKVTRCGYLLDDFALLWGEDWAWKNGPKMAATRDFGGREARVFMWVIAI